MNKKTHEVTILLYEVVGVTQNRFVCKGIHSENTKSKLFNKATIRRKLTAGPPVDQLAQGVEMVLVVSQHAYA